MAWSILLLLSAVVCTVVGHGRVLDPPARGSAWRVGFPTNANYDDDGLNCGGFSHQWISNGGRCGICGDAYDSPTPRAHELGGIYGQGVIVEHYQPGQVVTITIELTAYHRGYWEFKICPDPENNEQACFDEYPVELEGGGTKFYPENGSARYTVSYRLPRGLVCNHCVLQWQYTAGNNWGVCENGNEGLGCGNQETFWGCSDITIGVARDHDETEDRPEGYEDIPYPLYFYLRHGYFNVQQGQELYADLNNHIDE